jgi:hypothetical protein
LSSLLTFVTFEQEDTYDEQHDGKAPVGNGESFFGVGSSRGLAPESSFSSPADHARLQFKAQHGGYSQSQTFGTMDHSPTETSELAYSPAFSDTFMSDSALTPGMASASPHLHAYTGNSNWLPAKAQRASTSRPMDGQAVDDSLTDDVFKAVCHGTAERD